ncbi:MAG: hypothetical protein IJ882_08200 [Paludibacteraceae bacterium]|nr:hypothetical protein [Paludibacteraceae bacterium]
MKPYNVTLCVYADDEEEVKALQSTLRDFVVQKYNQHIYIRANKLSELLKRYGNNAIVNTFLM